MSHHNNPSSNSKVGGFKLSSNFNQLYTQKKQQTEQFIKDISDQNKQTHFKQQSKQKSNKKTSLNTVGSHGSLFKLNTQSQALVDQVPVQILKKKSLSRLQSLEDNLDELNKGKFSLLDNQAQRKLAFEKKKRQFAKSYNIDLNAIMSQQNTTAKVLAKNMQSAIQQEDPEGTVKPSQLYQSNTFKSDPFTAPTIFQTPLLPCFASQFSSNPQFTTSKTIRQGEGVWKIGKIKIKKNRAILKIGQIQFQSQLINGQGKCVAIKQDFMYKLKNWNGIWISQPKQDNF